MLLPWCDEHRAPFAEMHADPEVMLDLGGPIGRTESDVKLDRYRRAYAEHGLSRWAVVTLNGDFLGYAGVMPRLSPEHPLGAHFEVGWRLVRRAWGNGYATESARAALDAAFRRVGTEEIVSYTSAHNPRSQAVMTRLGLLRDARRDFTAEYKGVGWWHGMVWVAFPPQDGCRPGDR